MDSPRSGFPNSSIKLLTIETELFDLYIQGKPYHPTVEALQLHREGETWVEATVDVTPLTHRIPSYEIRVFSSDVGKLVDPRVESVGPCFYETQTYHMVIERKANDVTLTVHHDNAQLRNTFQQLGTNITSGMLNFQNEVGYTDFVVLVNGAPGLKLQLEIFPMKLDYKQDYQAILQEVNQQIYNLSFDFLRKTYNLTGLRETNNQSLTEFFAILGHVFQQLVDVVDRIQHAPHHRLAHEHQLLEAGKVKRAGKANVAFLSRSPHTLVADERYGIVSLNGQRYRPKKLIETKKRIDYDTHENRFLRWTLERIDSKLSQLAAYLNRLDRSPDAVLVGRIAAMRSQLRRLLQIDFLRESGAIRQLSVSLVLQMAPGYRDAYRIYLMLMKGLSIQSDLFHLSMKDLAQLYEYWCFLKIHDLLSKKYKLVSQDVIRVNRTGLSVSLDKTQRARMIYEHPTTHERFTLHYNALPPEEAGHRLPTLAQRPDNVLTITKQDANKQPRVYKYVFDAKYRINPAYEGTSYHRNYGMPGPEEDDINTMHRYRDAIVYQEQESMTYERSMFGAYVLFPYGDEERFKEHRFYRSIELLNIGAFPFLPGSTTLMEQFLDELILDSPEKAYERSTRPIGTDSYYADKLGGQNVIVVAVESELERVAAIEKRIVEIPLHWIQDHAQLMSLTKIALYQSMGCFKIAEQGIHWSGSVADWQIVRKRGDEASGEETLVVRMTVERWNKLALPIRPGSSHIDRCLFTSTFLLDRATQMAELRLTVEDDIVRWRELKRQGRVKIDWDCELLEDARELLVLELDKGG